MVSYNQLLKQSFSLYKENLIIVIPYSIIGIFSILIYLLQIQGFIQNNFPSIIFQSVSLLLFIILECGALGMVVKLAKENKTNLKDFKRAIEKRWKDYLGTMLLVLAILFLGIFPYALYKVLKLSFLIPVSIIGVIYSGASLFLFLFFKQAVLIDGKTPIKSLEKSLDVVRNNLLQVIIYLLILVFVGFIISLPLILSLFYSFFIQEWQLFFPLGILTTIILSPIVSLYSVLFYLEVK